MESGSSKHQQHSPSTGVENPRRGFLRKSLIGATPLVLTAISRPVLGNQCTVSGMMSGNLSAPGEPVLCAGLTPGFWKNHLRDWPEPYDPGELPLGWHPNNGQNTPVLEGGTLFNEYFTYRAGYFDDDPPPSMLEVMQKEGYDDKYRLGAHAVAALLNATYFANMEGVSFGYTADEILSYWNLGHGPGGTDLESLKEFYMMLNERGFD